MRKRAARLKIPARSAIECCTIPLVTGLKEAKIRTTGVRLIQNKTFALVTKRLKGRGFMGLAA